VSWRSSSPMSLRLEFVAEALSARSSFRALCARYGISEKTGYKWRARFLAEGPAGLVDRSHAPHTCPHRIPAELEALLLAERTTHPTWGARKLRAVLVTAAPTLPWPAASTLTAALGRAGQLASRRRRPPPATGHPSFGAGPAAAPNDVWSVDFKGEFRTGDGQYCYPLTVLDGASRMLLACRAHTRISGTETRRAFERLFATHGLPLAIRSDNGVPFATTAVRGLSPLSAWWVRHGIGLQRIRPGCPQDNGAHERMHRTLKAEATLPPRANAAAQQRCFNGFLREYNEVRPHEALGQVPPATRYVGSPRPYGPLPPLEYAPTFEERCISANGGFRWAGQTVFLTKALAGERVGFDRIADDRYAVYFGTLLLGHFTPRTGKMIDLARLSPSPIIPV